MKHDPVAGNPRVGAYYGLGALCAALLAICGWPWTAPLLWPALALLIVLAGYLGVGPTIYRKRNGVLTLTTRLLMAPVILGQHLSLQYYRRQCRPWDEAAPGVWMGRLLNNREADRVISQGITAVLDLTAEFSEIAPLRTLTYRNLPILDLTAPTMEQLRSAVDFIRNQCAAGGRVYVHCKVGYSRTAAVVGAYLIASGRCRSAAEAVQVLRTARPPIVIRPEALQALQAFEQAAGRPIPATPQ